MQISPPSCVCPHFLVCVFVCFLFFIKTGSVVVGGGGLFRVGGVSLGLISLVLHRSWWQPLNAKSIPEPPA